MLSECQCRNFGLLWAGDQDQIRVTAVSTHPGRPPKATEAQYHNTTWPSSNFVHPTIDVISSLSKLNNWSRLNHLESEELVKPRRFLARLAVVSNQSWCIERDVASMVAQHLVDLRKCLVQQQPRQCLCYPSVPGRRPQASPGRPQVSSQVVSPSQVQQ